MPHITKAMRRSLRRRVSDIVLDSLLGKRQSPITSITNEASSVKNSFSSWDNCMKATYCKWPVIIAIIVAALIVFSILSCIIRCACCGMSCCCSCFSFLKCCDCCGGCCDGKRNKPHKHLDDPYYPPPQQGYQAPAPMMGGALGGKTEPPQYAQFEVGKNGLAVDPKANALSEDALPPMPSWETAAKKHVPTAEHDNAVELGELDHATGQQVPLMAGGAGGISQPPSPGGHSTMVGGAYGAVPGPGGRGNGYTGIPNDPYHQNQDPYQNQQGYGGPQQPGRLQTDFPGQPGRSYSPSPVDPYASPNDNFNGIPVVGAGGYGRPQQQNGYGGSPNNRGPGFRPPPGRQYSSDSARPLNPGRQDSYPDNFQSNAPPRGPPRGSPGPGRHGTPPMNNSGFDFGGGAQQTYPNRQSPPRQQQQPYDAYFGRGPSRNNPDPQSDGYSGYAASTAPPTYVSRASPAAQEQQYSGGYNRPYQQGQGGAQRRPVPPRDGFSGGGGGRGYREQPQTWDPVQR